MSIVLLAIAMFMLMTYFLTIGESSAIMFERTARTDVYNIQHAIQDDGNCGNNLSLCAHIKQIYGSKYKLSCSKIGDESPYNYTITFKSKVLDITQDFTQNIIC